MRIGIDFDNTIISYDRVFNTVGVEKGLIPAALHQGKRFVREYLRETDQEEKWTWLQGYVYGSRLGSAEPYKGVKAFLYNCISHGVECFIISHKTVYPYSGDKYNLHTAALDWIKEQGIDLEPFFELTKEDKVKRIADLECDFFIDDLPEFLALPGFPKYTEKILFDPLKTHDPSEYQFTHTTSWEKIQSIIQKAIQIR